MKLIKSPPPLVEGYIDLARQVQPNGIDLTIRDIAMLQSPGRIAAENSQRLIPPASPLAYDFSGWIDLIPGPYLVTLNEIVNLPRDIMALAWPRSSLLRCGVSMYNAVWDAGYSGRSQALLVVHNPQGFGLQKNAQIIQMVFLRLSRQTEGYNGIYQGENIERKA